MTPLPTGRARSDAPHCGLGSESECVLVLRTCVLSRLFYEADRGPRLAAQPENRPRRNLIAPVCASYSSRVPEIRPCADEADKAESLAIYNAVWPLDALTVDEVRSFESR